MADMTPRFHPLVLINGDPKIGEGTRIGIFSEVYDHGGIVKIGRDCDIASLVGLNCASSHRRCLGIEKEIDCKPISLGDNVFVGEMSVILGGAHIGHHCVVAAGTVVREGVYEPYSLIFGNPCRVRRGYYKKKVLGKGPQNR